MMSLFDEFLQELPPIKECLVFLRTKKNKKKVMLTPLHEESLPLQCLNEEIVYFHQEAIKKTTTLVPNLGKIAAAAILKELRDPRKAVSKILSSIGGKFS